MKKLLTLICVCAVAAATSNFANDIVPIDDNQIYVCAREAGEKPGGLCSGEPAITNVDASLTFYRTSDGKLTSDSKVEAFHKIEGQLISNSIGAEVYEFKGSDEVKLDSSTFVGVVMKLERAGFEPYYSQIVPLRAFGIDSRAALTFHDNGFNQNGFVSDAFQLIGRSTAKRINSAYVSSRFEPRYMQYHNLVPMHVKMARTSPSRPGSTEAFENLYKK